MQAIYVFCVLLWFGTGQFVHMADARLRPAQERRRYYVTPSLIDRAHT